MCRIAFSGMKQAQTRLAAQPNNPSLQAQYQNSLNMALRHGCLPR
jgi:hypothetical protein